MTREAKWAGSAFGVPDSLPPGDGWVAGPAPCFGPVRRAVCGSCGLGPHSFRAMRHNARGLRASGRRHRSQSSGGDSHAYAPIRDCMAYPPTHEDGLARWVSSFPTEVACELVCFRMRRVRGEFIPADRGRVHGVRIRRGRFLERFVEHEPDDHELPSRPS